MVVDEKAVTATVEPSLKEALKEAEMLKKAGELIAALNKQYQTYNATQSILIRRNFADTYIVFGSLFAVVSFVSLFANSFALIISFRSIYWQRALRFYLSAIAIINLITSTLVAPFILVVDMTEVWMFGQTLCYTIPILYNVPPYVVLLLMAVIGLERYRKLRYPEKLELPGQIMLIAILACCICAMIPFRMQVHYFDITPMVPANIGQHVEMCQYVTNAGNLEYVRALFTAFYVLPLCVTGALLTKANNELRPRNHVTPMVVGGIPVTSMQRYLDEDNNIQVKRDSIISAVQRISSACATSEIDTISLCSDVEISLAAEKRVQKHLSFLLTLYGLLWAPLQLLHISNLAISEAAISEENDESNKNVVDVLHCIFNLVGLTSTCVCGIVTCLLFRKQRPHHVAIHRSATEHVVFHEHIV